MGIKWYLTFYFSFLQYLVWAFHYWPFVVSLSFSPMSDLAHVPLVLICFLSVSYWFASSLLFAPFSSLLLIIPINEVALRTLSTVHQSFLHIHARIHPSWNSDDSVFDISNLFFPGTLVLHLATQKVPLRCFSCSSLHRKLESLPHVSETLLTFQLFSHLSVFLKSFCHF